jgi:hypothetical protein
VTLDLKSQEAIINLRTKMNPEYVLQVMKHHEKNEHWDNYWIERYNNPGVDGDPAREYDCEKLEEAASCIAMDVKEGRFERFSLKNIESNAIPRFECWDKGRGMEMTRPLSAKEWDKLFKLLTVRFADLDELKVDLRKYTASNYEGLLDSSVTRPS